MLLRLIIGLLRLTLWGVLGLALWALVYHPASPLPSEWNPVAPLDVALPVTPVTQVKLARIGNGPDACLAALEDAGVQFTVLPDVEDSEHCHIRTRVRVTQIGQTRLRPLETRCDLALRLALWDAHSLQPLAQRSFGQGVSELHHLSSYSCRPIRTLSGPSSRWSTHATAQSVDITGVTLDSGRRIDLLSGWSNAQEGPFLQDLQTGACEVFGLVLGPNYNRLHADHFHIQTVGAGCR